MYAATSGGVLACLKAANSDSLWPIGRMCKGCHLFTPMPRQEMERLKALGRIEPDNVPDNGVSPNLNQWLRQ